MGVSADIEAVSMRLVGEAAMDMAEEVPRPVPRSVPLAHGIVAQDDAMAALMDFADVAHARKERGMMGDRLTVMIAGYEMDLAVELTQIGVCAARVPVTEVAEMIDCVARSHAFIPARDQRLIHFRNACERAAAQADDVFVPEMGVGYKEDRHAANFPPTTPSGIF